MELLAVPGNMDRPEVGLALDEIGVNIHGRGRVVRQPSASGGPASIGVLGVGGSTPTPWGTPFEVSELEVTALLDAAWPAVQDTAPVVLVAHPPPFRTRLDRAGTTHAGSSAVREFVARHPVAVSLSGHIHESVAQQRLAGTLCVNPGAFRSGRYATLEWTPGGKPRVEAGTDRTVDRGMRPARVRRLSIYVYEPAAVGSGMNPDCRKPPSMGMAAPLM